MQNKTSFSQNGVEHAHAFILSPEACRFCDVEQNLNGKSTACAQFQLFVFENVFADFVICGIQSLCVHSLRVDVNTMAYAV